MGNARTYGQHGHMYLSQQKLSLVFRFVFLKMFSALEDGIRYINNFLLVLRMGK